MNWTKAIFQFRECYVSGIYRVTSYREGEYLAFYIADGQRCWGDFVADPPDVGRLGNHCWATLDSAIAACEKHAETHSPNSATVRRAAKLAEKMEILGPLEAQAA